MAYSFLLQSMVQQRCCHKCCLNDRNH